MMSVCMLAACGADGANAPASTQAVEEDESANVTVVPEEAGVDVDDAALTSEAELAQAAQLTGEAQQLLTAEAEAALAAGADGAEDGEEDGAAALTPTEEPTQAPTTKPTPSDKKDGVTQAQAPTEKPKEVLPTPTPIVAAPTDVPSLASTPASDTGYVVLKCYGPDGGVLSGASMQVTACDENGTDIAYPGYPASGFGQVKVPYDKSKFNRIRIFTILPDGYHFEDTTDNAISDWNFVTTYIEDTKWADGKSISIGGSVLHVAVDDFE